MLYGVDDGDEFKFLKYNCFDLLTQPQPQPQFPHIEAREDVPSIITIQNYENKIKEKEKEMEMENKKYNDLLDLYKKRKIEEMYQKYTKKVEEIDEHDSIQNLIIDTRNQLNVLLNRKEDDGIRITVDNLHGQHLRNDDSEEKINLANKDYEKQRDELDYLIKEVSALLAMTDDYDEQIKILKKYDILNKDGKLNV